MKTLNVNGQCVVITEETIKATRQWYADNCQGCIDEVVSGKVRVNDKDQYIIDKLAEKAQWEQGLHPESLAFWQRALYIQTNECVGILG